MQTEAVFENIAERIEQEISKAQKSIFIAVAWFTNANIFNALLVKAKWGCKVNLLISDDQINKNSSIGFDKLVIYHSHVYRVGDGEKELMHHKFCVIDYNTVITGSYNWSYKAETNFENIVITYDDNFLAEQFVNQFNHIIKKYFPNEAKSEIFLSISNIYKRLEILKNYILLEDVEEIKKEAGKLESYEPDPDLEEIIEDVRKDAYAAAISNIQRFLTKYKQLSVFSDQEIIALKFEITNLENQLNAFDNEKIELEKLLSEFQHRHAIELGVIILEILRLRKIKFKSDRTKYKEAEKDERHYREQVNEEKERNVFDLTEVEKIELKKKFRKATILCHPDKVNDEMSEAAHAIFIDLKEAYDLNDLVKVTKILNDLQMGNFFKSKSETISEKELLILAIKKLRIRINLLEIEIRTIKQSETYKSVAKIALWDEYFNNTREELLRELEELRLEIV